MTVAELIKKLEKMPKDVAVTFDGKYINTVEEKVTWPGWSLDSVRVVNLGEKK